MTYLYTLAYFATLLCITLAFFSLSIPLAATALSDATPMASCIQRGAALYRC